MTNNDGAPGSVRDAMRALRAAITAFALLAAGACSERVPVPPTLQGRWVAHGGQHDGLAFEIDCRRLVIHQADGVAASTIRTVAIETTGPDTVYDLKISTRDGGEDSFRVQRSSTHPDALLLDRIHDVLWVRDTVVHNHVLPQDTMCTSAAPAD